MAAVGLAGGFWKEHWPGLFSRPVGLGLLGLGAVMGGAGALQLGGSLTPFPKPRDRSRLVQHGVYGVVRHPLYCSVLLASLGWALVRASLPALSLAVVLGVFLNAKADHEEAWLRQRYPGYGAYAERVRKLLPFIF
jgi:protein-S-isoprenylcysteine O-methyltransferase Ste14